MKIQISNNFKEQNDFNTIRQCIEYFLEYEIKFGYFDSNFKEHIAKIIDEFSCYRDSPDYLVLEFFVHDYNYFSKYITNPSLYIPIDHYKKEIHFEIDLDQENHISLRNIANDFHQRSENIKKLIVNQSILPKQMYLENFKQAIFNQLILPVAADMDIFDGLKSIDELSSDDIELIKMFKI